MRNFRTIRALLAPRWLTDGEGGLVGYSLDLIKDAFVERLRLGLLARFPQQDANGTPAPSDALAAMGRDRLVIRGIGESDATYAARLLRWLDMRKTQGNAFTLLDRLAEYTNTKESGGVCSFRTVDAHGDWYSRAADGTRTSSMSRANWDWEGIPVGQQWARFWVICYPNGLWTPGDAWGAGTRKWGDDPLRTWGSTATPDQIKSLRDIVSEWKPAGTTCINIILAFDPASFTPSAAVDSSGMPDGLWYRWSKTIGGVEVPARLSTARYLDGA